MPDLELFERALRSDDPGRSLRSLAQALAAKGQTKEQVYSGFEAFLLHLRERPNLPEKDEDAVLDAMDAVAGWCHPDAALFPE